jgi:hypothetical protein
VANYSYEVSFNTQSGVDLPWELLEELYCSGASGNGFAFFNVGNALPSSHLYTMSAEWEELSFLVSFLGRYENRRGGRCGSAGVG